MSERRTCSQCEVKLLRSNNTTGVCSTCRYPWQADRDRAAPKQHEAPPATTARKVTASKVAADAVGRFKIVADALGFDGTRMLEEFAQSWLDRLQVAASMPPPGKSPAKLPASTVRLQRAPTSAGADVPATEAGGRD